MIIIIKGVKYLISWTHNIVGSVADYRELFPEIAPEDIPDSHCICKIYKFVDGNIGEIVSVEIARCSRSDQYNKNRGRKISLSRALRLAFPGEEYFNGRRGAWIVYQSEIKNWRS